MILSFTLSMPNNNAWNGKWTGKDRFYARAVNFGRSKKKEGAAQAIIDKGYYYYNFGDGWGAGVTVKKVDSKEARHIRNKSAGFCGYDWMIDSIRDHGDIRT
jgi:hypothetical protein